MRKHIASVGSSTLMARTKAFKASRAGLAAVEFALILPLLLIMFFGVIEGSGALTQSRKVSLAVNTLADLAAQELELLEADADDLFSGVEQIVGVNGGTATIRLVSVISDDDGNIMVHWSRDNSGGEPYSPGAPYDDLPNVALLDADASIIVGEIDYSYSSNLTHFIIPTINFDRLATRWPRRAMAVELCSAPGNCTSKNDVVYSGT